MNNQVPTERERIPEFVNLEEYIILLGELDFLEEKQLSNTEITIKLKLPEVIAETIKLIANVFHQIPQKKYLQHCVLNSISADIDIFLRHHKSYEKLFELINKLNGE